MKKSIIDLTTIEISDFNIDNEMIYADLPLAASAAIPTSSTPSASLPILLLTQEKVQSDQVEVAMPTLPVSAVARISEIKSAITPDGCEDIKAELLVLDFLLEEWDSLSGNCFIEEALNILSKRSKLNLKNSVHRCACILILYRLDFPNGYKLENLAAQIETAMHTKFENISNIEIFHKLIALRTVSTLRQVCKIINAYCPANAIVSEYAQILTNMNYKKVEFLKIEGIRCVNYRSCSYAHDINGQSTLPILPASIVAGAVKRCKPREIKIPNGCEGIKAQLKILNFFHINPFTERACQILFKKAKVSSIYKRNRTAGKLILYCLDFPNGYKAENLAAQIKKAICSKFGSISDIEILHKLIALRAVIVLKKVCTIIGAYCRDNIVVSNYKLILSYMHNNHMEFLKIIGNQAVGYRSCSYTRDIWSSYIS